MKKRILSLLLALSLAISLLPMMAFAGKIERAVLYGTTDIDGVYFGSYPQTANGEGGYTDESIRWRLLSDNFSPVPGITEEQFARGIYYTFNGLGFEVADTYDSGTSYYTDLLFMLSNDILDVKAYHTDTGTAWETSALRDWLNGYGEGSGFTDTAFAPYEEGVLIDRPLPGGVYDRVFLLSKDEAETSGYGFDEAFDRCATGSDYAESLMSPTWEACWWLRTPTADGLGAYYANLSGAIVSEGPIAQIGVRPAIMIDGSAVYLSVGYDYDNSAPFDLTGSGGGIRSLTVHDGTAGFAAEMATPVLTPSSTATVTVTSLGEGSGYTQISAMLLSGTTVVCYGSIGEAATGDATFDVPAGLAAGSYTLRVFAENVQGPNATNYAGNYIDIPVTVGNATYPAGTKVMLADGSEWIVLEDDGGSRFTLAMDGFLSGTYSRTEADTALTDYQTAARLMFEDDGAATRLPTQSEVEALGELHPFADQETSYWLADGYEFYQWANGNGSFGGVNPVFYEGQVHSARPVLTVLKSALDVFEPYVTEQPEDVDYLTLDGDDAEFSASAVGMGLTYQWQLKEGESFSDIIGADSSTLVIPEGNGLYEDGTVFRCKLQSDWDTPVYTDEAALKTFDWAQYGDTYAQEGADFIENGGTATVTIHTAAGLGLVAARVNEGYDLEGVTVALDADIDLSGRVFVPIGDSDEGHYFRGHFDGQMHKISGMTARGLYFGGLFGVAEDALIENLIVADGSVGIADVAFEDNTYYLGAVCGYARATTIRNIGVGPVTLGGRGDESEYIIGGIVGYLRGEGDDKCVYNSYSRALITGGGAGYSAGGIAGRVRGDTVANCYFAGSMSGSFIYSGGIAGTIDNSELTGCYMLTGAGATCAYYGYVEDWVPLNDGCTSLDGAGLKSAATVTALNAWVTAGNAAEDPDIYESWAVNAGYNGGYPYLGTYTPPAPHDDDDDDDDSPAPARTIAVTETSSPVFEGTKAPVKAVADMNNAFTASVEVKLTDSDEDGSSFSLGAGQKAYPFDISLYLKGTSTKVEPKDGYAVTISLPIPEDLLAEKEQLKIVHKAADGTVETLSSELKQIDGVWYLVFKATEFSPYALVASRLATYDEAAGLPYYLDGDVKTFIGFAANGKYIAPEGKTVLTAQNPKAFSDTAAHWAAPYIRFVAERELFTGTAENVFSPDERMTRAMFATVLGRLYERSFGKVQSPDAVAFTDCDYSLYYGNYVNWATANGILTGYGDGLYGPNDPITREQMAAILYRFAQFMGFPQPDGTPASPFADEAAIPAYALPGANFCKGSGILTGREDGSFAPKDTATRAEVAASIERLVEYVVK